MLGKSNDGLARVDDVTIGAKRTDVSASAGGKYHAISMKDSSSRDYNADYA